MFPGAEPSSTPSTQPLAPTHIPHLHPTTHTHTSTPPRPLQLLDLCLPFLFHSFFHATTLIFMLVYLWSRQNQNAPVSFFGLLTVQARTPGGAGRVVPSPWC